MIKSEHELKISQQRLKEFRQAFLELKKQHPRPEDFELAHIKRKCKVQTETEFCRKNSVSLH